MTGLGQEQYACLELDETERSDSWFRIRAGIVENRGVWRVARPSTSTQHLARYLLVRTNKKAYE